MRVECWVRTSVPAHPKGCCCWVYKGTTTPQTPRAPHAALSTIWCYEAGHMAGSDASEGQAVWQPGGAEEDSRLREGNRHLHLAYDEEEEEEDTQSCAYHVQHIKHLSPAMCPVPLCVKGQLSCSVWQSWNHIYFRVTLLAETMNQRRRGEDRSTWRKPLTTSFRSISPNFW